MENKHELRGGVTISRGFRPQFRATMLNQAYTDVHVLLSM